MKIKILSLVFTLFLLGSMCFSIDVYLGITQGFNIGMQYKANTFLDRYGAMVGFNGGLQANVSITNLIGIEADVLVSIRGGRMHDSDEDLNIRLTYIDLPVLFKLSKNVGWCILQLNAGAQLSFNLKGYYLYEDNGTNDMMEELDTRVVDIGPVIGAGIVIPVKKYYFSFELRNSIGLLYTFDDYTNRNVQISFLFSYGFKL